MCTKVVAYSSTIVQPFNIFRKLLVIIPSMQNYPHLIILNQKISTNTKPPMLLTLLVLQYLFKLVFRELFIRSFQTTLLIMLPFQQGVGYSYKLRQVRF